MKILTAGKLEKRQTKDLKFSIKIIISDQKIHQKIIVSNYDVIF
jgi:hypothetical protein